MSLTMPPPLPDPPFARVAYVPHAPQASHVPGALHSPFVPAVVVPRPVGAITCFCLYLALPLTALFSALFLYKQYLSGAALRFDGHHLLIKVFDLFVLACTVGVTLLAAGVALVAMRKRLTPRVRRRAWAGVGASVVVTLAAMGAAEPVFRGAKSAAYARVNPKLLTADCFAAAAAGPREPSHLPSHFEVWAVDPTFPAYARSLGAKKLRVRTAGVRVTMSSDLNGVREEGYYVPRTPLDTDPATFAAREGYVGVVSAEPPVFRFADR